VQGSWLWKFPALSPLFHRTAKLRLLSLKTIILTVFCRLLPGDGKKAEEH